jgi:hypothetical protein
VNSWSHEGGGFRAAGLLACRGGAFVLVAAATARGDPFRCATALGMVSRAMTDHSMKLQGARKIWSRCAKLHQQDHRKLHNSCKFSKALSLHNIPAFQCVSGRMLMYDYFSVNRQSELLLSLSSYDTITSVL